MGELGPKSRGIQGVRTSSWEMTGVLWEGQSDVGISIKRIISDNDPFWPPYLNCNQSTPDRIAKVPRSYNVGVLIDPFKRNPLKGTLEPLHLGILN